MKRIRFLFLLFISQIGLAQFNPNDVKYFVGTGTKTVYLVLDFNDENTPTSYVWGYRYDSANLTMEDLLNDVATADVKLDVDVPSGFLYSIVYNHHAPSTDDYWSTWSGTASHNMKANKGVNNDPLVDGKWYGASYGYGFTPSTSFSHPSEPVAAYNSQWYKVSDIKTWLGTGSNQSLVIVDFGTDTANNADSYVFGIKYNGTITAEAALNLIATEVARFDYVMNANELSSITIGSRTETETTNNTWQTYKGTDLSNWIAEEDFSQTTLDNNQWLGLSIGTRRPFTPQEITASLSVNDIVKVNFSVYPNPANEVLNVLTNETIKQITIYNMQGQKLIQNTSSVLNIASLSSGMYLLELQTTNGTSSVKFIKK